MKKAGIITYHFATNYGAILQCYALFRAINNLGIDCKVIDFISEKQLNNNSLYRKGKKNIIKNIILLPFHKVRKQRANRIKKFSDSFLCLTNRINNIDQLQEQVINEKMDFIISGSDQVWNPYIEDFESAFFFPFNSKASKIGYAVSIGKAQEKDLLPYDNWIKQFSKITVREESSKEIISKLAGHDVSSIVDPVFLLSQVEWIRLINQLNYSIAVKSDILVCYFVGTNLLEKKIQISQRIADKLNLKLIIISPRITKYNFTKKVVSNAGPLEFLKYLNNASFICTDSFHGTVFSILLNRQFCTLETKEENKDSRKKDILKKVDLQDQIQYLEDELKIRNNIDYERVNPKVDEIRSSALANLKTMLN